MYGSVSFAPKLYLFFRQCDILQFISFHALKAPVVIRKKLRRNTGLMIGFCTSIDYQVNKTNILRVPHVQMCKKIPSQSSSHLCEKEDAGLIPATKWWGPGGSVSRNTCPSFVLVSLIENLVVGESLFWLCKLRTGADNRMHTSPATKIANAYESIFEKLDDNLAQLNASISISLGLYSPRNFEWFLLRLISIAL